MASRNYDARQRLGLVVADFARRQDERLSWMLANVLRRHVPADELELSVESFRATVDGTYARRLEKRERHRVLSFALERIMQPRSSGT